MEQEIKGWLIKLLDGIKAADGEIVAMATEWLDDLAWSRRSALHPQLVHFLQKRSYQKALLFLDGEPDIPAGICGGGRLKTVE
jgi:hypothetical protein